MIQFEFDQYSVAAIERRLGKMKSEAPKALKTALNATAKNARTDLAHKAQATYAVKVGGFASEMRLIPATAGNLVAILRSRGASLEMRYFSVQGGTGGPPLTVMVKRTTGRHTIGKGFRNTLGSGGKVPAMRHGSERLPIKKLFSVSIPQMIGNEREVYGVVKPSIEDHLENNVERQIARILAGG